MKYVKFIAVYIWGVILFVSTIGAAIIGSYAACDAILNYGLKLSSDVLDNIS